MHLLLNPVSSSSERVTSPSEMLAAQWSHLRSRLFHGDAREVICDSAPEGVTIVEAAHMRSAHYAVYRADDSSGKSWVVRIGVTSPEDDSPVDNSGYLGTSLAVPTGQQREHLTATSLHQAGGSVCLPRHYARTSEGYDVLWLPFLNHSGEPLSAEQWQSALTSLYRHVPGEELPVFTNRAKTLLRIHGLGGDEADVLTRTYDRQLAELFRVSSRWSVVHGDAHSGNAIHTAGRAVLYDFDTTCWAPSVWDVTHLLNRAGQGDNTGYTADALTRLFDFSDAEIHAALELRRTAALVAKMHRERTSGRL